MRFSFSILPAVFLSLGLAGCDYAKLETVQKLERDVDDVRTEQSSIKRNVESTERSTQVLQASISAMGSGFNVLTESVSDTGTRVGKLEVTSKELEREVKDVRKVAKTAAKSGGPKREPNSVGLYLGSRLNTKTLDSETVRMRWCEDAEGVEGYLVETGRDPNYDSLQCWRYGNVAIFRQEIAKQPLVRCLRDIQVDESGNLKAMDCEEPILYTLSLR